MRILLPDTLEEANENIERMKVRFAELKTERDELERANVELTRQRVDIGNRFDLFRVNATALREALEKLCPCADCGIMRTKAEGGTVFTVCDACRDRAYRVEHLAEGHGVR